MVRMRFMVFSSCSRGNFCFLGVGRNLSNIFAQRLNCSGFA